MSWLSESGLPRKARQAPVMYRSRVNADQPTTVVECECHLNDEGRGHFSGCVLS